jgi:hypothetical protein
MGRGRDWLYGQSFHRNGEFPRAAIKLRGMEGPALALRTFLANDDGNWAGEVHHVTAFSALPTGNARFLNVRNLRIFLWVGIGKHKLTTGRERPSGRGYVPSTPWREIVRFKVGRAATGKYCEAFPGDWETMKKAI